MNYGSLLMSKLSFRKPSGESRLTDDIKKDISQVELQRFNFDLPKDLFLKLKVKAAMENTSMKEIAIDALTQFLK